MPGKRAGRSYIEDLAGRVSRVNEIPYNTGRCSPCSWASFGGGSSFGCHGNPGWGGWPSWTLPEASRCTDEDVGLENLLADSCEKDKDKKWPAAIAVGNQLRGLREEMEKLKVKEAELKESITQFKCKAADAERAAMSNSKQASEHIRMKEEDWQSQVHELNWKLQMVHGIASADPAGDKQHYDIDKHHPDVNAQHPGGDQQHCEGGKQYVYREERQEDKDRRRVEELEGAIEGLTVKLRSTESQLKESLMEREKIVAEAITIGVKKAEEQFAKSLEGVMAKRLTRATEEGVELGRQAARLERSLLDMQRAIGRLEAQLRAAAEENRRMSMGGDHARERGRI